MIRKFIALILVLITTLSVPGFTLFVHYCNGKAEAFSFFSEADPCLDAKTRTCCVPEKVLKETKPCCKSDKTEGQQCSIQQSDCCDSQIIKHKGTKILSYRPALKIQSLGSEFLNDIYTVYKTPFVNNTLALSYFSNAPPLPSGKEICVKVCSFLI